jgi:formimidoylglutamate deiminase
MSNVAIRFMADRAWVQGRWESDVLLEVGANGLWSLVQVGATLEQQASATRLSGPVLPGLVNAHSHAFQRAIAGLTERRSMGAHSRDDFWSWRERMYAVANRVTPEQLEAIASQLYAELLAGGYTQVCEFHYLHNDVDGAAYAKPAEMCLALVRAAQRTGIGLTLLPTLYMRSGFTATGLREDQRRFASTPDSIARIVEEVQRHTVGDTAIHVGIALHSLRAVDPLALREMATYAHSARLPVHIHIAEQTQEVEDCISHTGMRPIEWLLENVSVDVRWNLVHATHTTPAELAGIRQTGAAIVICPTTEANLGDGVFDLPGYGAVQGNWSIGSDSHVCRSWVEELRLLEYSQRLSLRKRNVAAQALQHESSAAALFEAALSGGAMATGRPLAGIAVGQRADFVTLHPNSSALLGIPQDHVLDALVFSGSGRDFDGVYVGGRQLGMDALQAAVATPFVQAMRDLWANPAGSRCR